MQRLGAAEASVVLCDDCRRHISVRGIRVQRKERGEYCMEFFTCPHCGRAYQINTTDERQRELLEQRAAALRRLQTAAGHRFREKAIKGYRKSATDAERELKERAPELRRIGDEILTDGGQSGGAENRNRGTESL